MPNHPTETINFQIIVVTVPGSECSFQLKPDPGEPDVKYVQLNISCQSLPPVAYTVDPGMARKLAELLWDSANLAEGKPTDFEHDYDSDDNDDAPDNKAKA